MLNENILDTNINQSSNLSDEAKSHLYTAAKWGKFLSIVGFVMVGLIVIMAFAIKGIMSTLTPLMGDFPGGDMFFNIMTFIYLFVAVIYFFPCLYLFRFSTKTKMALDMGSTVDLTEGLGYLKSMFKFMGILVAIVLGFYALMISLSIVANLVS